jgi:hypothetical protein
VSRIKLIQVVIGAEEFHAAIPSISCRCYPTAENLALQREIPLLQVWRRRVAVLVSHTLPAIGGWAARSPERLHNRGRAFAETERAERTTGRGDERRDRFVAQGLRVVAVGVAAFRVQIDYAVAAADRGLPIGCQSVGETESRAEVVAVPIDEVARHFHARIDKRSDPSGLGIYDHRIKV